jgi:hypothetical protein
MAGPIVMTDQIRPDLIHGMRQCSGVGWRERNPKARKREQEQMTDEGQPEMKGRA